MEWAVMSTHRDMLRVTSICYLRIAVLGVVSCVATVLRIAVIRLPFRNCKLSNAAIRDLHCLSLRRKCLRQDSMQWTCLHEMEIVINSRILFLAE